MVQPSFARSLGMVAAAMSIMLLISAYVEASNLRNLQASIAVAVLSVFFLLLDRGE